MKKEEVQTAILVTSHKHLECRDLIFPMKGIKTQKIRMDKRNCSTIPQRTEALNIQLNWSFQIICSIKISTVIIIKIMKL